MKRDIFCTSFENTQFLITQNPVYICCEIDDTIQSETRYTKTSIKKGLPGCLSERASEFVAKLVKKEEEN